jgi:3-hydroxyacyl-[acyl-carrier-protein] dehydratase
MLDSFYKIINTSKTEEGLEVELFLNSSHPLFAGHFPGMPILPGACMVQLTHHLVDRHIGGKTTFEKASQIKFLMPINPLVQFHLTSTLKVKKLSEGMYKVDNQLSDNAIIFFKFSATYSFHA